MDRKNKLTLPLTIPRVKQIVYKRLKLFSISQSNYHQTCRK